MIECEGNLRKWGNSFGVSIPKDKIKEENMKENEKVRFIIWKQGGVLKNTFGMLKGKWKNSGQRFKDKIRRELYND